ncbi:hypothetical protein [Sanguibacter keddieii]|uniref:hypothetical protein n=1 Tax=Sanguibacter keddieii TaxID=60920 RepID=UPI0001B8422C|nr:hypothetical protein [Sanguibacter keddieii]
MGSPAGIVVVAVVVLWLAYLVPQRLRHRQQLVEARVDDRFSGRLRVLAVASEGAGTRGRQAGRGAQVSLQKHGDCTVSSSADVSLLTPPIGTTVRPRRQITDGVQDMERNDSYGSASRDALLARRAAAARRRATLTLTLLALTAVVGVLGATTALPVWTVAVPGLLLVSVLVLGRRAVLANARADQAAREREAAREAARPAALRRAGRPAPAVRTTVTGRAVHPSQTQTEMISRVRVQEAGESAAGATTPEAESATAPEATAGVSPRSKKGQGRAQDERRTQAPAARGSADDGSAARGSADTPAPDQPARPTTRDATDAAAAAGGADWEPVAVPRPVYTLKSAAPRWEPAPLTAELRKLTEERRAELAAVHGAEGAEADQQSAQDVAEEPSEDSLGVNLNSVLARRRVAGE